MINSTNIWKDIQKIRAESPLVHNITNYVVMNTTANALLAIGASPVMAHSIDEVEEMVQIAKALVINIGTLSKHWIEAMHRAVESARKLNVPIVLDPVGAGATKLRTQTAHSLIQTAAPTIIRGNASEIRALYHAESETKGVDTLHSSEEAIEAGRQLSRKYGCAVSISGEVDVIIKDDKTVKIFNGHPLMPRVTGLGCTASAITGAFAAVNPSAFHAAAHAMAVMGVAGEIAAEQSKGPGTLQLYLLDTLHQLNENDIIKRLRLNSR